MCLVVPDQACYGHTEGTAGITGALLAITALQQAAAAPIVNLRSVNPYVTAALSDWRSLRKIAAHAPRQLAPGSLLKVQSHIYHKIFKKYIQEAHCAATCHPEVIAC